MLLLLVRDAKQPSVIVYEAQNPYVNTVTVLLHGRCNVPEETCKAFAPAVTKHSWLACPAGPLRCPDGTHTWGYNTGEVISQSLSEVRKSHPELSPVPVVVGYSLGAYRAASLIGKYPKMLLVGARVDAQPLKGTRLVLAAGDRDMVSDHAKKQTKVLQRQQQDARFYSLGNTGHYLTEDFSDRLEPALEYLYGP